MNRKQKREILKKKPLCVCCLKNFKYEKATEVADDGTPMCMVHYKKYINDAFLDSIKNFKNLTF